MIESDHTESRETRQKYTSRIGWIKELNPEDSQVKIEFEHHPCNQTVWATLGRSFSKDEIHMAIDNQLDCRIDFIAGDLALPTVVDIYMSMLGEEELIIKAKRVVLDGEEEVVINSGAVQVKYSGCDGRVSTTAKHINTSAQRMLKIQGSKISLN